MSDRLEMWAVERIPEIRPGDDLARLIARAEPGLCDDDVVVVTSKAVSKAEGRLVPGSRDDHLEGETVRVVAARGPMRIVETRHGFVMAAAGIDASNVPAGVVALLPVDPDESASRLREGLRTELGVRVAVIVSDTMGRPWREGVTDVAIGAAGLDVLNDLRGEADPAGHRLEATIVAVADELAAAADLVKGKLAGIPVAVIRGLALGHDDDARGARPLLRRAADDLFRLGTREAMAQVVADSAPLPAVAGPVDVDAVNRAVAAVGHPQQLTVSPEGVVAVGEPLEVGAVVGRLLAALAAEGIRAAWTPPPDGATAALRLGAAPG